MFSWHFRRAPLIILYLSVFIVLLDPLGLHSSTQRMSENLIFRFFALSHPEQAAQHISIVIIDDKSARELNKPFGYPMPFDKHANVLRHAMCSGPSSLFIDLNFRYLRLSRSNIELQDYSQNPPDELKELIASLKLRPSLGNQFCPLLEYGGRRSIENSVVYLARMQSQDDKKCDPFFNDSPPKECLAARALMHLKEVVNPITISALGHDGAYMLATPSPFRTDRIQQTEPLPLEASPALAMVLAFCQKAPKDITADLKGCQEKALLEQLLHEQDENKLALIPRWPFYRTAKIEADEKKIAGAKNTASCPAVQNASNVKNSWKLHLQNIGDVFFHGLYQKGFSPFGNNLCIPYDYFSASDLINLANHGNWNVTMHQKRKAQLLSGRMIFYGANITAINDVVYSPVLGYVPGVVVHATVADNLLNYGIDYLHRPGRIKIYGNFFITQSQILEILLLIVFFICFQYFILNTPFKIAFGFFVSFGAVMATILSTFLAFHFPPANLIGIVLLVSILLSFARRTE